MEKMNTEHFVRSIKRFSEQREKFLLGDWLLSLNSDELNALVSESRKENGQSQLLVELTMLAIFLETPVGTEARVSLDKAMDCYNVLRVSINLVLISSLDPELTFKPVSIFSEDVEFLKTHSNLLC
jgi:hypothetical protein